MPTSTSSFPRSCPGANARRRSTNSSPEEETILAVIDAPTSELATQATAALIEKLSGRKDLFQVILEAGGGPFFQKNGLLFLPTQEVAGVTKKLGEAKPVLQSWRRIPICAA